MHKNLEHIVIVALLYALNVSFIIVGIMLFSVFNPQIFIDLTVRFIILSLIPFIILYIIDCVYDKIHHQNTFIQSHLEWLSYNYIMYLGLFLLNHWLIEPLLDLINIHFNIVFLFITLLILIRYVSGFNLALSAKNAPHHNLVPYLSRYIFNYFKKILANKP